jgi:hypothetical protein
LTFQGIAKWQTIVAYSQYATKNENSYLYNTLWKKGKKKKKKCGLTTTLVVKAMEGNLQVPR